MNVPDCKAYPDSRSKAMLYEGFHETSISQSSFHLQSSFGKYFRKNSKLLILVFKMVDDCSKLTTIYYK